MKNQSPVVTLPKEDYGIPENMLDWFGSRAHILSTFNYDIPAEHQGLSFKVGDNV